MHKRTVREYVEIIIHVNLERITISTNNFLMWRTVWMVPLLRQELFVKNENCKNEAEVFTNPGINE